MKGQAYFPRLAPMGQTQKMPRGGATKIKRRAHLCYLPALEEVESGADVCYPVDPL